MLSQFLILDEGNASKFVNMFVFEGGGFTLKTFFFSQNTKSKKGNAFDVSCDPVKPFDVLRFHLRMLEEIGSQELIKAKDASS